jgi:hypothetical protein
MPVCQVIDPTGRNCAPRPGYGGGIGLQAPVGGGQQLGAMPAESMGPAMAQDSFGGDADLVNALTIANGDAATLTVFGNPSSGLVQQRQDIQASAAGQVLHVNGPGTQLVWDVLALDSLAADAVPRTQATFQADVANTAAGENDLFTTTLSAGRLGSNGDRIEARYFGKETLPSVNTLTIRIYFGGTQIYSDSGVTGTPWEYRVSVLRVSSTSVRCEVKGGKSGSADTVTITDIAGLTLSNTQIIKITGQSSGGGTSEITAQGGTVDYIPHS